ncbi:hypothetical protein D9M71_324270 [compost metagenome]
MRAEPAAAVFLLLLQLSSQIGVLLAHLVQPRNLLALVVAQADTGDIGADCVLPGLQYHLHRGAVGFGAVAALLRQLPLLLRALLQGAIGIGLVEVPNALFHLHCRNQASGVSLAQALHALGEIHQALLLWQCPIDQGVEGLDVILHRPGVGLAAGGGGLVGLLLSLLRIAQAEDCGLVCFGGILMLANPALCGLHGIAVVLQVSQLFLQRLQVALPGAAHAGLGSIVGVGGAGIFVRYARQHSQRFSDQCRALICIADGAGLLHPTVDLRWIDAQALADFAQYGGQCLAATARLIQVIDDRLIVPQLLGIPATGIPCRRRNDSGAHGLRELAIRLFHRVGCVELFLLPLHQRRFTLVAIELGELLAQLRNRLVHVIQADASFLGVVTQQQEASRRRAGQQCQAHGAAKHRQQACRCGAQPGLGRSHGRSGRRLALTRLGQLDRHLGLYGCAARGGRLTRGQNGCRLGLALVGDRRL